MVENNSSDDIMFSVEVTTYNQKYYIAQTLQSIIEQKHNYKYEILVGDDCSTDGTQDIIREYAKKYPNIVKPVFNEKNLGAMPNYYKTIARAKGKYLMGCAGDDYWLPGKAEKQISFMERNLDFDVCYGMANVCDANNKDLNADLGDFYKGKTYHSLNDFNMPALTLCIRSSFFSRYMNDVMPQTRNWKMEDLPFLLYTSYENRNFHFIEEPVAVYRVIDNSLSHQKELRKKLEYIKSIYDIRSYFAERFGISYPDFDIDFTLYDTYREFLAQLKTKNEKNKLKKEYEQLCEELHLKPYSPKKELSRNAGSPLNIIKKLLKFLLPYGFYWIYKKISVFFKKKLV